jgi:hypothetical protein
VTTIAQFEGARKNLLRSCGIRAERDELKRRRTGRTTKMLLDTIYHQGPARVIGFNLQQARLMMSTFKTMLKDLGIPHDSVNSSMVVRVRKFGARGGTFEVAFTSHDFLAQHSDDKRDPEYLKTFFDER